MSQPGWRFTDDPDDPCGLCVVWEERPDDPMMDHARPVWPDGTTASRIYRHVHRDCQASAIAYTSEATL